MISWISRHRYHRHIPDDGMTTDVSSYMFGSILAMSREDMYLSVVLSLVVLGMFVICYNKVFAVTFDESFAKATGVQVSAYNL